MLNNCVLNKQTLPAEKLLCVVCSTALGLKTQTQDLEREQVTQVCFSLPLTSFCVVPSHLPQGLLPYKMGGNPLSDLQIFRATGGV